MSKLAGHFAITLKALDLLQKECPANPVLQGLKLPKSNGKHRSEASLIAEYGVSPGAAGLSAGVTSLLIPGGTLFGAAAAARPVASGVSRAQMRNPVIGAVVRDLKDVVTGGHWKDAGQKHHFMRRFDGQVSAGAYKDSVAWIEKNCIEAANSLRERIRSKYVDAKRSVSLKALRTSQCPVMNPTGLKEVLDANVTTAGRAKGPNIFVGVPSTKLGNALHCLQDSYSPSHCERDTRNRIVYIKVYEGEEKEGHGERDHDWRLGDSNFSELGWNAISATRDLVTLVLNAAAKISSPSTGFGSEFPKFVAKWLAFSPRA